MTKVNLPSSAAKKLFLFEKEKGGTGSTGSLVSAAHVALERNIPRVFIECSVMQNDVLNAYGEHDIVHVIDLKQSDAGDRFLTAVAEAPPGAALFANVPGGRIDVLDDVHRLIRFVQRRRPESAPEVTVVWTMGLDAASRMTLDALLGGDLPGRLVLNLPQWWGEREKYEHVDDELVEQVLATGGDVIQMPALPDHLYNIFRSREVAIDLLTEVEGFSLGNSVQLEMWAEDVDAALETLFR